MTEKEEAVLNLTREICCLHRKRYNRAIDSVIILDDRGFGDVSIKFVEAIYKQLSQETEKHFKQLHERSEKAFIYEITTPGKTFDIWSERYLLIHSWKSSDSDHHEIEVLDTFNDKQIKFKKSEEEMIQLYGLDQGYGFIVEAGEDALQLVSFVYLDFYGKTFQTLDTVKHHCSYFYIKVNKEEPTEFVLNLWNDNDKSMQVCKIDKTKIVAGELIEMDFSCKCYSGECLYDVNWIENEDGLQTSSEVAIYNVRQKSLERFNVDLPEGYSMYSDWIHLYEFIGGRIFNLLRYALGGIVAAYIDLQDRKWVLLDFAFNANHLVVFTSNYVFVTSQVKLRFHKFQMRKPDLLQNTAWFTLIKRMKKIKHPKGPYEAARKYLPYNSQIRCPFVDPEPDEKTEPTEKLLKHD